MELLLLCAILGCIPGAIASSKGRSFGAWWLYGALIFIVALIHSLCLKKDYQAIERSRLDEGFVKCPFCAELVKPEAVKCKHCGSDLTPTQGEKGDLWIPYLYFSSSWGNTSVNRGAVADLVCYLLSVNSNMQREEIIDKYQQRIDTLAKGMPPAVRSSFLDCYNELMREE
ncbi:zinc ribbon domain-containing protein [Cronobacter malonaticus]|uniref:zinc ribbon domain-containing protein n=1 Tax=Cronobacter malonaticus TaxID=413503 RepID=UPI0009078164|nr:zinc ribbon domain-containing protein [Cronobacter malonaticus]MDI6466698.1 zinc ribbon domain-containing protein [Cronobacter malonaticus]